MYPNIYEFIPISWESYTGQNIRARRNFKHYLITAQRRKQRPEKLNNLLKVTYKCTARWLNYTLTYIICRYFYRGYSFSTCGFTIWRSLRSYCFATNYSRGTFAEFPGNSPFQRRHKERVAPKTPYEKAEECFPTVGPKMDNYGGHVGRTLIGDA